MMKGMISKYNSLMGDSCIASLSSLVFRLIIEDNSTKALKRQVSYISSVLLFLAALSFAAQSSYDLMERANALYRDGKFKQAITLYRKAESRGADPVATSFNIANSYYQLENLPEAAATYRKAIDFSNGAFSPALFNMASVYFRLKQYPECVAAYHRALKLEPENVSGWLYLGEAYSKTGDAVGALRAIEKAYQLDKDDISIVRLSFYLERVKIYRLFSAYPDTAVKKHSCLCFHDTIPFRYEIRYSYLSSGTASDCRSFRCAHPARSGRPGASVPC